MNGHKWTDEETKRLAELAAAGYPSSSIAMLMGYSRGAVLGRCTRLEIKLDRDNPGRPGKVKKPNRIYPKKAPIVIKLGKPGPICAGFRGY